MKPGISKRLAASILAGSIACLSVPLAAAAGEAAAPAAVAARDGSHDFDFNFGVWKSHIRRRLHPLSGSNEAIELDGTVTVSKVWDGRAQLEEIEADGPKGHWQALTLFLYNPKSQQWSQTFINSARGVVDAAMVGEFRNGRGELYQQDTLNGRSILVRGVWSDITPDSHHYEESYSDDGGRTWEWAFDAHLARVAAAAPSAAAAPHDGSHDFDFDFGTWKTHSSRLLRPLTGSNEWVEMDGVTEVRKIWGGRANLAEVKADGPAGPLEILAMRWYNPTTRQWYLDFANTGGGTLGIAAAGEFRNGRCDFYDIEPINGRSVLVRFSIWEVTPDTTQSEQAFSADGGKSWEVNWKTTYTRIGGS